MNNNTEQETAEWVRQMSEHGLRYEDGTSPN